MTIWKNDLDSVLKEVYCYIKHSAQNLYKTLKTLGKWPRHEK